MTTDRPKQPTPRASESEVLRPAAPGATPAEAPAAGSVATSTEPKPAAGEVKAPLSEAARAALIDKAAEPVPPTAPTLVQPAVADGRPAKRGRRRFLLFGRRAAQIPAEVTKKPAHAPEMPCSASSPTRPSRRRD